MTIIKVIGNPGSGKTHKLLSMIDEHLETVGLHQLAVVSYTRAAVHEVRDRVIKYHKKEKGVDLSPKSLMNIKTLHGFCYSLLNMRDKLKKEGDDDQDEETLNSFKVSSMIGMFMNENPKFKNSTGQGFCTPVDQFVGHNTDMKVQARISILINIMYPVKKWVKRDQEFFALWNKFCVKHKFINFDSILRYVLAKKLRPRAKYLFIDEAQDLTPLQLEIIKMWDRKMMTTYLIGDVNQSIFRFAGASPEKYEEVDAETENMGITYRVPEKIFDFAKVCLGEAAFNPVDCESHPDLPEGSISIVKKPDLTLDGSHMILCRTNRQLEFWKTWLKQRKMLWSNPYKADKVSDPLKLNGVRAIKTVFKIFSNMEISFGDLQNLYKNMYAMPCLNGTMMKTRLIDIKQSKVVKTKDYWEKINLKYEANRPYSGLTPEFFALANDTKNIHKIIKVKKGNEFMEYISTLMKDFDFLTDLAYDSLTIPTLGTMHSVKGAEADHVWVDMYIYKLLNKKSAVSYKATFDERRLLYVACTRAKKTLGLLDKKHGRLFLPNPILIEAIKNKGII